MVSTSMTCHPRRANRLSFEPAQNTSTHRADASGNPIKCSGRMAFPALVERKIGFLRRFGWYAPMIPTSPFFMRDLVTLREHDIFTNCRLPAFSAHVRNYHGSAPRNWLALFFDPFEVFPFVPEGATAGTVVPACPTCQRLPVVGVVFHLAPPPEIASIISHPFRSFGPRRIAASKEPHWAHNRRQRNLT
jgi:hypothetical protein